MSGPSLVPLTTATRYDPHGNVYQVQQPNGDVVYNTYDASDRLLTTETDPTPVTPSTLNPNKYDSYTYDPAGNQTLHVDADGRASTMQCDGDNRVLQSVDATSVPTGTTTITTTPSYDPNGNTITQTADATNPGVVATHTYTAAVNAAGWPTSSGDDGGVDGLRVRRGRPPAHGDRHRRQDPNHQRARPPRPRHRYRRERRQYWPLHQQLPVQRQRSADLGHAGTARWRSRAR